MEVTSIQKQKKGNRLNLEVDGMFYCGIDEALILELDLYAGKSIDQKLLDKIRAEDDYQKCLKKAYDILAIRLNSEKELRQKLRKKFDERTVTRVITRLRELKYVNDNRFIELWVEGRENSRGSYLLKRELSQKGIDRDIVMKYFKKRGPEEDYLNACKLIARKKWEDLPAKERSKRVGALLARRGFDYATVKRVISKK